MATTKLYLEKRHVKPGNPSVLKIAISYKDKTCYISLEVKLLPLQWDPIKEKINEGSADFSVIGNFASSYFGKIQPAEIGKIQPAL